MTVLAFGVTAWLVNRLTIGSFQAVVLVALVWLACRRQMRLSAALQATLWWLALLKILLVFAPLPSIPIPVLPAVTISASPPLPLVTNAVMPAPPLASHPPSASDASPWLFIIVGLWLAGAGVHAAQLLRAFRRSQAMVNRSRVSDDDVDVAASLAVSIGLSFTPEVRTSDQAVAPYVVGIRHPVVLMPPATALSSRDRMMALGHELMHVKRGDLARGWIPAVAERLFFFHPAVRLAAREYLIAREAACDAAVIRALDVSAEDYGRLLVRFGVSRPAYAMSAGGASGSSAALRRRLDMLQHLSGYPRRTAWLAVACAVVAFIPVHLVARTASTTTSPVRTPSIDIALPQLPSHAPAVMPAQQGPVAPRPERVPQVPEKASEPQVVRPEDVLNDRVAEIDALMRDAEFRKSQAEVERDQQKIQEMTEAMRESLLERASQANQAAEDANRIQRETVREAERRLELLRKEQDRALDRLLADQPEARQRLLQQRFQELQSRLEILATMQRQLQFEADQLKQQLGAAK